MEEKKHKLVQQGSNTAKNGFKNEADIVEKFNNWKHDNEAKIWLEVMEYNLNEIEFVKAVKISGYKTDVQVQVTIKLKDAIDLQNLQVKLVSNNKGFNQIDKRWINKYIELWNIPEEISILLKKYTGELKPTISNPKDKRRMFASEFSLEEQELILSWLNKNKSLIVNDILKGRGKFSAEWMLVVQKINEDARWTLKAMNIVLNYFGNDEIVITKQGNFKIGKITMQRKGGDGGRNTANMLQFKINPAELFDLN
jgi:hypothetical protein